MTTSIRNRIARFISETNYNFLTEAVVKQSKRCLLDFLGVALASGNTDLVVNAKEIFFKMQGEPEATIIGEKKKIPVMNAAFVNGIKGHTLDMDDGNRYGNVHPGVVVFPAALSLAENLDVKGQDFLEAVVAGYETTVYLAKTMNPQHLKRGFHTTANTGAFGAAAACSKILGLELSQVENALAIAGLCGGGLLEVLTNGQMMKPFQTARASQAGLMAALLAKSGAEGPLLAFEGEKGFFRAYTDKEIKVEDFNGLGNNFEILNTYFKRYPVCRHIHSALEAADEIQNQNHLEPEAITEVVVETYTIAFQLTGSRATETSEAAVKFSMPMCLALMMVHGSLERTLFSESNISDRRVQSLADKITIRVDGKRDACYPQQRGAKVMITANDQRYEKEVNIPKGEPENPMNDKELSEKFYENAGMLLPMTQVKAVEADIFGLEDIGVRQLMTSLANSS